MSEHATRTVWGVDFSASESDAGRKTWIADCQAENGTLQVQTLDTVSEYLDLETNNRKDVLSGLVEEIGNIDDAVVAIDFPFSIPSVYFEDEDWVGFVEGTPDEWGNLDDVSDPTSLYEAVKTRATEDDDPLRRATDDDHGGQNPAGFRIKTQTYYGISSVLRPLVEGYEVAIPPLYETEDASTTVIETYPAAVFDDLDAERRGYTSDDRAGVATRRDNLKALEDAGVELEQDDADCVIATDDALDALAAAYAAWAESEGSRWGELSVSSDGRIYTGHDE